MSTLLACSPAPVLSPGISSSITDATSEKHSSSEKKRKQRSVASLSSGGDISGPVQHSEEGAKLKKKSKKRKLESGEIADIAASSNFPAAGNGSPRTGQPDGDDATPAVSLLSHEDRTDKKRKKKRVHDAQGEDVGKADARLERKKKKKAEVTESQDIGVVDPRGDNTLSEQATKALSYAYLHHYDRKTWKFSKPRQIWLVKNLWSESQIPEKYTPLLAHYLASIQSNLRTKLIDTCNERLASNPVSAVPVDENAATISTETSVIRDRASAILRAMKPT